MQVIPQNDYLLCKKVVDETSDVKSTRLVFSQQNVPEYVIEKIPTRLEGKIPYKVGDRIAISSVPTKAKVDENEEYWLVNQKDITGTIA